MINSSDVSRETLESYIKLLLEWNNKINLIGKSTLDNIWERHIVDSLQLMKYIKSNDIVLTDFGSGAGFPGLILAFAGVKEVHLIESDKRKARFLREAASLCKEKVIIHDERIENLIPWKNNIITARALAPLDKLLKLMEPFINKAEKTFLLKGRRINEELGKANKLFKINYNLYPSITSEDSWIMEINSIKKKKM